jgi:hypothetical protein
MAVAMRIRQWLDGWVYDCGDPGDIMGLEAEKTRCDFHIFHQPGFNGMRNEAAARLV